MTNSKELRLNRASNYRWQYFWTCGNNVTLRVSKFSIHNYKKILGDDRKILSHTSLAQKILVILTNKNHQSPFQRKYRRLWLKKKQKPLLDPRKYAAFDHATSHSTTRPEICQNAINQTDQKR